MAMFSGERKVSEFIKGLVKPYILPVNLKSAYREMSLDKERERKANEWSEGTIGDISDVERWSLVG